MNLIVCLHIPTSLITNISYIKFDLKGIAMFSVVLYKIVPNFVYLTLPFCAQHYRNYRRAFVPSPQEGYEKLNYGCFLLTSRKLPASYLFLKC